MKFRLAFVFILCVSVNLIAQDLKSGYGNDNIQSYPNKILNKESIKINQYNDLFEESKILLQHHEEMNPNQINEFDRLFDIQDTTYILDSTIYYRYPSENDSVYDYKIIPHFLSNGKLDFNEEFIYDTLNLTWINSYKTEYYYNTEGLLSYYLTYIWSEPDQGWIPFGKSDYEYNEFGYTLLRHYQNWNTSDNLWISNYKLFYDYDENGNRILDGFISWSSENNMWMSGYRYEYEYNDYNQITINSRYTYDPYYPGWIGDYKTIMEYDGDKLTSRSYFTWSDWWENNWILHYKYEFQYDGLDRQTIIITSIYDEYEQVYYKEKKENVYDVSDQLILMNEYQWIEESWILQKQDTTIYISSVEKNWNILLTRTSEGLPWDSITRVENNFDEITGQTEMLEYSYMGYGWLLTEKVVSCFNENYSYYEGYTWDASLQKLIGTTLYEYNKINRRTFYTSYDWSTELNNWVGDYKYSYEYFDFMLTKSYTRYYWDNLNNSWKVDYKYFRYYSTVINTDIDPVILQSGEILIYPNPASDFLNISLVGKSQGIYFYHIYDLTGKLIIAGRLNGQSTVINVSELQNGMYIIRVGENPSFTLKILIQK